MRSIPACAGEPARARKPWPTREVYPRLCGGTRYSAQVRGGDAGLSPPVRGNPRISRTSWRLHRSIPACAGEPSRRRFGRIRITVYPRLCGGTEARYDNSTAIRGLSPPVRGNHAYACWAFYPPRSIPACAGEPPTIFRPARGIRVYPRLCGGTGCEMAGQPDDDGLSPPVRGNRRGWGWGLRAVRSIPACAGEPGLSEIAETPDGVYPRLCGGTTFDLASGDVAEGLSPPVRGNPPPTPTAPNRKGSIPACAGEPAPHCFPCAIPRVYPRLCGGTVGGGVP